MEFIGNFFVVASQVVTLFLLMGVGFVMAQLGKLHTDGVSQMSTLVLYVVTPCLMISAFEVDRAPDMVETLGIFFVVYTISTLLGMAVAALQAFSLPSNYILQQLLSWAIGFLSVAAVLIYVTKCPAPKWLPSVLVSTSVIVGIFNHFF